MALESLVQDVRDMLENGVGETSPPPANILNSYTDVYRGIMARMKEAPRPRTPIPKTLRASEIGHPCNRKLWYSHHQPEDSEYIQASLRMKFLAGDMWEPVMLYAARLSGHEVTDEQKEVEVPLDKGWRILGHMDAKIDGHVVDVKSAASFSFTKFTQGLTPDKDGFGYLPQLATYVNAEQGSKGAFFVIDKQLGHIHLDVHFTNHTLKMDWDGLREKTEILESKSPPPRPYGPVKATHKRLKLDTQCSYCSFKKVCWPDMVMDFEGKKPIFKVGVAHG